MNKFAIEVSGLSKSYKIGMKKERYRTLRETITDNLNRSSRLETEQKEFFWALKDINFTVRKGETLGIIGRNGAGKSTLLKILSRITKPTSGRALLNGLVGSLLEVGTGFHPELTGRENIYLNGAIIGMRRTEIDRKFDEIVDFSGIEKYLDTPVKRYSSGMYVRLAFSVAAHLEPDILLVDEVLAVGDAEFQKKCLGKISDVAFEGRTVILVSHNMAAVKNICSTAILIEEGHIKETGNSEIVIHKYLDQMQTFQPALLDERTDRKGNGRLRFTKFEVAEGSQISNVVVLGNKTRLNLHYKGTAPLYNVKTSIGFYNELGERIVSVSNDSSKGVFPEIPESGIISVMFDKFPLTPGTYYLHLFCQVSSVVADWVQMAAVIEVQPGDFYGSGKIPANGIAQILIPNTWNFEKKN